MIIRTLTGSEEIMSAMISKKKETHGMTQLIHHQPSYVSSGLDRAEQNDVDGMRNVLLRR